MKIIKLAIRSILHFKTYSGINILGMALSLACVITIFRYVYGEFTVDRFNKNLDRIFVTTREAGTTGVVSFLEISNPNVDLIKHPSVENYSHFIVYNDDEIDWDNRKYNATVLVADSNFLKITDYPVISGVANLSEPNSALITKRFAQKLFGNQNPVGQTFRHSNGKLLTITGIIGQTSTKATLSFDIVVSRYLTNNWNLISQTFVLLYPGTDYRTINKQYEMFFEQPYWKNQLRYQLFPLSKVYFDRSIDNSNSTFKQGNDNYVNVLMAVGVLILLVGIVSYINIYTVVVLRRGRELGIKRVFGAEGYNIYIQLVVENLLMSGLALITAFLFAKAVNPLITNILQLGLISDIRFDIFLSFIILLSLPVITTLYPFLRYHYSTPVNSMQNFDKIRGTGSLRQIFLSFQYIITIVMIVVSLFFIKQLQFMLNADPGYRTKDIIKVKFLKYDSNYSIRNAKGDKMEMDEIKQIVDEVVQKMNACPLFTHWTYGESPNVYNRRFSFKLSDGEFQEINLRGSNESWFRIFNIPLKEGRLWDDETDIMESYFIIVTESLLKLYGITDFNSVLLQPQNRLWMSPLIPQEEMGTTVPYQIVGVVKDFDYLHLSQKSEPTAFYYSPKAPIEPLIASIVPRRTKDAIEFLRNLHDETIGGEFSYSFVDDEIHEMYKEDRKIASIYSIFTFIAIFISALGLFGMSLFDIQYRRKEIAIRKVNGASVFDVIRLLLKKYCLSLTVSFVIATPVAVLAINRYLEDFANKAPVSWWLFAVAVALTVGISLLTLIYQTVRAANQNPAGVLKSE